MTPSVCHSSNTFEIIVETRKGEEIARYSTAQVDTFAHIWGGMAIRAKSESGYAEWDGLIQTDTVTIRSEDTYAPPSHNMRVAA